jgi:hypothetical protein
MIVLTKVASGIGLVAISSSCTLLELQVECRDRYAGEFSSLPITEKTIMVYGIDDNK